jgi:antirestriction protein ArdC
MRTDVYEKITNQIVSELEKGVRPWHHPWKAEHAAGRITRPLRGNGVPYQGINVLPSVLHQTICLFTESRADSKHEDLNSGRNVEKSLHSSYTANLMPIYDRKIRWL